MDDGLLLDETDTRRRAVQHGMVFAGIPCCSWQPASRNKAILLGLMVSA